MDENKISHSLVIMRTKAKVHVYADSVLSLEKVCTRTGSRKVERAADRFPDNSFPSSNFRSRRTTNWVWVEYSPRTYCVGNASEVSVGFTEQKHDAWEFWRWTYFHSHVQRHWLGQGKQWRRVYCTCRRNQRLREEILARTLDVPWIHRK